MQARTSIPCSSGNPASKLCMDQNCKLPSAFCAFSQCQCQSFHKNCLSSTSIDSILFKLSQKGADSRSKPDPILLLYENAIKKLTIDRDEYKKTVFQLGIGLIGNEKKLYGYLQAANTSNINSKLVRDVCNALKNQQLSLEGRTYSEYVQQSNRVSKQLNISIKQLKQLWHQIKPLEFTFKQISCPKNIFKVTNGGRNVHRHCNPTPMTYLAVLQPSLCSTHSHKKLYFKLNKINIDIYIGICHLPIVTQNNYEFRPGKGGGSYMVNNKSGMLYSHNDKNRQQETGFEAKAGDVIKVEYFPANLMVLIENKTRKVNKVKIQVNVEQKNPLHVCFGMYYPDTEVEVGEIIEG